MKKPIAILLILTLLSVCLLGSCGDNGAAANDTSAEPTQDATTTEAPPTTTPEPTEPPTTKAPPTYSVVKEYKFTEDTGEWVGNANFKDFKIENGVLKFTSTGGDPSIRSKSDLNLVAADIDLIRVEVKNMTDNDQFQLFFTTDTLPGYDETKSYKYTHDYIGTAVDDDTQWNKVELYTDEVYEWEGTIKGIRIDPVNIEGDVWIRSITFLKRDEPAA